MGPRSPGAEFSMGRRSPGAEFSMGQRSPGAEFFTGPLFRWAEFSIRSNFPVFLNPARFDVKHLLLILRRFLLDIPQRKSWTLFCLRSLSQEFKIRLIFWLPNLILLEMSWFCLWDKLSSNP